MNDNKDLILQQLNAHYQYIYPRIYNNEDRALFLIQANDILKQAKAFNFSFIDFGYKEIL